MGLDTTLVALKEIGFLVFEHSWSSNGLAKKKIPIGIPAETLRRLS